MMGGNNGGRYIQCDEPGCANTFSLNLPWNKDGETVAAAKEAGWLKADKDVHYCPEHAKLHKVARK